MENAAKALTIAGTILISVLVISAVVFMYRDLTSVKRQDAENQKLQEIIDFNKSFESFDKKLNGAKMLSLANKIYDYNRRYISEDGYTPIALYIDNHEYWNDSSNSQHKKYYVYFSELQSDVDKIMEKYISANYLEALYEAKKDYSDSHLKKEQAQQTIIELEKKLGNIVNEEDYEEDYKTYKQYLKFKNQSFEPAEIEYDKNGRIIKMSYTIN